MNEYFFIISLFIVFTVISYSLFGKKSIFNLTILFWFFFWYFLDNLLLTGFYPLSDSGKFVIRTFFITFIIGSILVFFINKKLLQFSIGVKIKSKTFFTYYRILLKFYIYFLIPIYLFFTIRGIYLMNTRFSMGEYRADVFGLVNGTSTLFFNKGIISLIFFYFLLPLIFSGLFVGVSYLVRFRKYELFLVSLVLIALDAIMMAGRFGFHYIFFSVVLVSLIKINVNFFQINSRTIFTLFVFLLVSFLIVMYISKNRAFIGRTDTSRIIEDFVVDYHTASFHILDYELNREDSLIHDLTYGLSTFSGLERYILLFTNLTHLTSKIPEVDIIGGYLHPARNIGIDHLGKTKWYNAYGSSLFILYRDGAIYGVIGGGFLLGMLVQLFALRLSKNVFSSSLFLSGFMYMSVYSLFQAAFTGPMIAGFFLCVAMILHMKWLDNE